MCTSINSRSVFVFLLSFFQASSVYNFSCSFLKEKIYYFIKCKDMEGKTQQALKFALQYLIENHCITWLQLFCIDCTLFH